MLKIKSTKLPEGALLESYRDSGNYTDCFCIEISKEITHKDFVKAFYTTRLFKLERFILKWVVSRPSTDAQAFKLAEGKVEQFAAWTVEKRTENQLLLTDYLGKTRSWLMVVPCNDATDLKTCLYFGSAVVKQDAKQSKNRFFNLIFNALSVFHKLYSIALLYSAKSKL